MELDEPRKPNEDIEHAQAIPVESVEDGAKTTRQGVVLVPQPSSDPRDPLVRLDEDMRHGDAFG